MFIQYNGTAFDFGMQLSSSLNEEMDLIMVAFGCSVS